MKIAIEGCAHGELDNIYQSIEALENEENIKVDLLICCGDFQSVRNEGDLRCMAVPPKYYDMCTFYKYYSGEKVAPVLTIFIGGNHEASNYLQELPYGGWVAPNIYYMGYCGVINVGGLRIAGLSGIYKSRDYMKGHFEMTPYSDDSKRSVYHIRNIEVFRLKQLSQPIDVFLSHDWPTSITKYGNVEQLLKFKPFFKDDIASGKLGSQPCSELLQQLKPTYWFAAHLHCKFAALVDHDDGTTTKFLALDKCLPKKRFLQIIDLPDHDNKDMDLHYDVEWLAIIVSTNHLFSIKNTMQYMPSKTGQERYIFTPTDEEKSSIITKFNNNLKVPNNFKITSRTYDSSTPSKKKVYQPPPMINSQTTELCSKLGIPDPSEELMQLNGSLDLSQLSQPADDSLNISRSYIEDTDFESSFNKSPVKTPLKLPKPVNEDISQDGDKIVEELVNTSADLNAEKAEDDSGAEVLVTQGTGTPVTKKLKRRNASIYDN